MRLREFLTLATSRGERVIDGSRRPLGYVQIANAGLQSAVGITLPTLPAAGAMEVLFAIIQSNGGTIRWTDDGTTPTASVGMLIPSGGELLYSGEISKLQLIAGTGTPLADIALYY